jgi:hypothetical protein
VGPLAKRETVHIVAYIVNRNATSHPTGYTCSSFDNLSCSEKSTAIEGAGVPDMRVTRSGRTATVHIAKDDAAPGPVYVFITRSGRELLKNHLRIDQQPYNVTVRLAPHAKTGSDTVCVLATFVLEGSDHCQSGKVGALSRFEAPN